MKKVVLLCALILLFISSGQSQVPSNTLGLNPPSLRWEQINTDKVQVIFPENMDESAQRVANIVHYLWGTQPGSIGELRQKVSILLHNQTVIPNGFVTVGPFRSEFYLTPPQSNVSTDWLDYLTIHEYRHVQQFTNATRGISKLTKQVLGSWAWGGVVSLALPRWYLEGDAVGMETALTNSGRGRSPLFDMEYRSLIQAGKSYSYEKAAAGSYRDFVPDWYKLGYYLTTYAREKYGPDLWKQVVADAGRYKGLFFPFSRSLKKHTGLSTKALYQETLSALRQNTLPANDSPIPENTNTVVNETNPVFLPDGKMAFYQSALHRLPTILERSDSDDKGQKLSMAGVQAEHPRSTLSAGGNYLCWAELAFDPRWANKNFSVIRLYDRSTGTKKKLTQQSKYFSPALNPEGTAVLAVEIDEAIQSKLVILNTKDGSIQGLVPNPARYFYTYPQWMPDGKTLIAVARKEHLMGLVKIDPATGSTTPLTPFLPYQLFHPVASGNYIFFSAAYTGIQNIFAVPADGGQLYQVTHSNTGAFQPACSPDGKKLAYTIFSAEGYYINTQELVPESWIPYNPEREAFYIKTFETLAKQESGSILSNIPHESFEISRFNRYSRILQPHSLLPLIDPPVAGLRMLSDNTFSTLSAELGGYYNFNEDRLSWQADLTYGEWYPEIKLQFRQSGRSASFFNFSPESEGQLIYTAYNERWTEQEFSAGLALPLNFSAGSTINRLYTKASWHHISTRDGSGFFNPDNFRDTLALGELTPNVQQQFTELTRTPLSNAKLQAINLQFQWSTYRRLALQHIYPRWGLIVRGDYRSTFGQHTWRGATLYGRADLYLPGAFRNHGVLLQGLYQESDMLDNYRFPNIFFFPRGYNSVSSDRVSKIAFNYAFPIAYPDLAIGPLAFIKRIKGALFTDIAFLNYDFPFQGKQDIQSSGIELTVDLRLLRVLDVNAGLRYSYLWNKSFAPGGKVHQFDFLIINISG